MKNKTDRIVLLGYIILMLINNVCVMQSFVFQHYWPDILKLRFKYDGMCVDIASN